MGGVAKKESQATAIERRYSIQGLRDSEAERVEYAVANMRYNKAYRYAAEPQGDPDGRLLASFVERFRAYRASWRGNPKYAIERGLHHDYYKRTGYPPLSVDIETAAACDLACSFCYRQYIATPDKIMLEELFRRIIDQCAELGVPSVKLNWRGEPLLHPQLPAFVDYAKRAGILETIINTNAVTLSEEKSAALIEAGLDLLIYSFDAGTKETYEKMRVGRFGENRFEPVYENIRRFSEIRQAIGLPFPRTKIQMILTEDTYCEQENFFALFADCVDDVSVKAYTERGGALPDLDEATRRRLGEFLRLQGLPERTHYWRDRHGDVFVSVGRLPCEQLFQRLMVTYAGTVSMCCYDWGSEHPIGYVDARAWEETPADYVAVMEKVGQRAKGFELLTRAQMPKRYVEPPMRVQTLKEIWDGPLLNRVRQAHVEGRLEEVPICTSCEFKETYKWVKLPDGAYCGGLYA